ncbi:MAG: ECF-type sigma factor [Alteraurantiacibacter sp.]
MRISTIPLCKCPQDHGQIDPRPARTLPLRGVRSRLKFERQTGCHRARRGIAIEPDTPGPNNFAGTSDQLIVALYDELRTIARREHYRAGSGATLQTTALINEAYVKLHKRAGWESRQHFLGCAATAIRHILIDAARARLASKRDAPTYSLTVGLSGVAAPPEDAEVARLGDALRRLALLDGNLAQVVDCRFFAGLSELETAEVMGVSDRTVRRWWVQARAWIHTEMSAD